MKVCTFTMIFCNTAVKVYKFAGFFLVKLLGTVDEVAVVFFGCLFGFFWVLVWFQLSRNNNKKFIKK
jgi:dolichol kinase